MVQVSGASSLRPDQLGASAIISDVRSSRNNCDPEHCLLLHEWNPVRKETTTNFNTHYDWATRPPRAEELITLVKKNLTLFLSHEEKYLILIQLLTLNSNM
jgi:hypothetical protein